MARVVLIRDDMLDRDFFENYQVAPAARWQRSLCALWRALEGITGTRVTFEGFDGLPSRPALIATNATQKYDFLPIRAQLLRRRVPTVTLTKGKNYHHPVSAFLLGRLGVVPLASRGYLLVVDFLATIGRRPTEDEYRTLRNHVDRGVPLPEGETTRRLESTARALLGHPFAPGGERYRDLIRRVYAAVMAQTLRLTGEAVAAGHHVHIYPEGTVSSRMGQGRTGAVQLAWALGLPIVPAGISGCRGAFVGQAPLLRGGKISVRFGHPYALPATLLPADFIPFDPEHEQRNHGALQRATGALMARIEGLVDPELRPHQGFEPDGTQGIGRFL
jgi:1-acyl-sn-glycerol-3-phosphate acyltransferase